jgi:hypothetical protein
VTGCGSDAAPVDASPEAWPADLLLYYPMDAPIAAATLPDATGHVDGFCTGGSCPTTVPGIRDSALQFDGDDMIGVASNTVLDSLTAYTVSLWVRRDGSGRGCLFGKRAGTIDGNTWQVCTTDSAVVFTSYSGTTNVDMATPALTSAWHHIALTWTAITQTETLYVDGVLRGSQSVTKVWDTGQLLIGGDIDDDNPTAFFVGALDDVRLYGRALSATELGAL